jgi:NAD(P)-dependent dehydrogenase (short-subunit alcohol dehydrogenase family)
MSAASAAVVVGGGSGIGAAVASRFRDSGTPVLTWDISGGDVACDISIPDQVESAARETLELFGAPATLTVTAGIGHSAPLSRAGSEEWDRVLNVNARGPWLAIRALAPAMKEHGGGSIVVTSSVSRRLADKTMGIYCASKAALDMVVKVAALEWGPDVRVNAVAPGVTETPMLGRAPRGGPWLSGVARRTPLGRLGSPGDIAEAIVCLHGISWMTGQVVDCDGGLGLTSPIDPTGELLSPVEPEIGSLEAERRRQ